MAENQNISIELAEYRISNMVALGILVWDVDIDITAEKSQTDPDDKDIDVNVDFDNGTYFVFTPFGYRFVQTCKIK